MKATILPSGEVILESTTETRIIRPSHASYSALAELYRRLGGVAQSQANKLDPSKGKAEYAIEPGYGGWPWKGGEPDYDEVYDIPLEAIHVDVDRFQFKKNADDETGVTTELDDEAFDPDRCEPLGVWKDPRDGKTYVVDGHHRRELGERAGVESMRCQYINADSAKEARKIGGAMNGVQLSQVHAPHTMVINGKKYRGGEFIPQDALNSMSAEDKSALLDKEHVQADDDGTIYAHVSEGANAAKRKGDHKTFSKGFTGPGESESRVPGYEREGFDQRIAAYFAKHLARGAEEWEQEAAEDSGAARDNAEQLVIDTAEHYQNSIINHLQKRWGDFFAGGDKDQFVSEIEHDRDEVINLIYEAEDSGEEDDYEAAKEAMNSLIDTFKDNVSRFEQGMIEAQEEDTQKDEALKEEISDQYFEDLESDVAGVLEDFDEPTDDQIREAWNSTIRDYNKMADELFPDNHYRISLDDDGDLSVEHKEDLPDEHKPRGDVKLSSAISPEVQAEALRALRAMFPIRLED